MHLHHKKHNTTKITGRDSSVGIANPYGLDDGWIELPFPVAERSKASGCGRSLAGVAGSNPAWAWMFVLRVVSKDKKAK